MINVCEFVLPDTNNEDEVISSLCISKTAQDTQKSPRTFFVENLITLKIVPIHFSSRSNRKRCIRNERMNVDEFKYSSASN